MIHFSEIPLKSSEDKFDKFMLKKSYEFLKDPDDFQYALPRASSSFSGYLSSASSRQSSNDELSDEDTSGNISFNNSV